MRVTVQIAPCLKSKLRFHVILSDLYTDIDKTGRGGGRIISYKRCLIDVSE